MSILNTLLFKTAKKTQALHRGLPFRQIFMHGTPIEEIGIGTRLAAQNLLLPFVQPQPIQPTSTNSTYLSIWERL
jgi:hypothetical protein